MPGRMFLERPLTEVASAVGIDDVPKGELPRPQHRSWRGRDRVHARAPTRADEMGDDTRGPRQRAWSPGAGNDHQRAERNGILTRPLSKVSGVPWCLPDGWYEWTGKARRKKAWRIRPRSGGLLLFAAITDVWEAPGGRSVHQVATVTCAPSADVRDVHHRMGVLIEADALGDLAARGGNPCAHADAAVSGRAPGR